MTVKPTHPRVYLLSSPSFDSKALDDFLRDREAAWLPSENASDAEHIVEVAGRVCYMSFSDDPQKMRHPNNAYIKNLIDKGHESVLEHASWTFIIDRVSRSFTHQLVRHRIGFSYSQLSQQYHDESFADVVVPAGLSDEAMELWKDATTRAGNSYRELLRALDADEDIGFEDTRLVRSAARSLLPNATQTTIAVTANARAIRGFMKSRGAIVGDIEMRLVCARLLEIVSENSPSLFSDISTETHDDGWPLTRLQNST